MERLSHNHAEDTSELLSTYVDNALDVSERRRAEAQVQSCAACAQELRDLRMFKVLLQDVPNVQPRRSFTLDPATAVGPRWLLFPTLRLATLVASVLFFVVLGVDVLNIGGAAPQATSTFSTREAPAAQRQFEFNESNDAAGGAPESEQGDAAAASKVAEPEASAATEALALMPSAAASAAASASAPPDAMSAATEPLTETAVAAANVASPTGEADQQPPAAGSDPAADQAQPALPAQDLAGGAQPSLQASAPISPDTIVLQPGADANSSGPQTTLRIIEIGLGLIALALASGAVWTWRRQR